MTGYLAEGSPWILPPLTPANALIPVCLSPIPLTQLPNQTTNLPAICHLLPEAPGPSSFSTFHGLR